MESSDDEDGPQPESNHAEDLDREQEIMDQLSENRAIGTFEKRSSLELGQFSTAVKPNQNSIVSIRDGGLLMCLGTVMSTDGYILTKASELHGAIDPEVILPSGRRFKAQELASDYAFDLMLLKVDATDLQPVSLMGEAANVGDLAVLQNGKGIERPVRIDWQAKAVGPSARSSATVSLHIPPFNFCSHRPAAVIAN